MKDLLMELSERIQWLIDNPKKPNAVEWADDCEEALDSLDDKSFFEQALHHIDQIETTNAAFDQDVDFVIAKLKKALRYLGYSSKISLSDQKDSKADNFIISVHRDFFEKFELNREFEALYNTVGNVKLREVFETAHYELNELFRRMNQKLPTHDQSEYFWADQSRDLLFLIDIIFELNNNLIGTTYSFDINEYYKNVLLDCQSFIRSSRGSYIPENHPKITINYVEPIFILNKFLRIKNAGSMINVELKLIGEGSYAKVYKYKDSFYNKNFVLKRALDSLDSKEKERFKREFEEMKSLSSPYVVEVYNFCDDENAYIMEYMDETLLNYINKNNTLLDWKKRIGISKQVLRGFVYTQSKNCLHRDISPYNILVKKYDDGNNIIKISDFGLVKIPDSSLTSYNTEIKGAFNDPALVLDGFGNYNLYHESYSLTRVVVFIMTGKINVDKIDNKSIVAFLNKGLNPIQDKRFQNAEEMLIELNNLKEE